MGKRADLSVPVPCPNLGVRATCSEGLSLELNLPSSPRRRFVLAADALWPSALAGRTPTVCGP